jgi:arylformamidase
MDMARFQPPAGLSRRTLLAAGAALAAGPALGQDGDCRTGLPPDRVKGPRVFLDYDQVELDAAYRQEVYQPHGAQVNGRLSALSGDFRFRRGHPERIAYGEDPVEGLDLYRSDRPDAPVFVFIHGGTWRQLDAAMSAFAGEMFLDAGAHFAALDFADVRRVGGDLGVLADQVRRGIAWVARNAGEIGADPDRIWIGGHSSGGHLAAVALTTDWAGDFDLPPDVVKGGLCISGMYDLEPVRLSWRSSYIAFTDAMEHDLSPQRHLDRIVAPVHVVFGTNETPEFQRQARDFAAALKAAGKPVELVMAFGHYHQDTWESLGNPYGVTGRTALAMMGLGRG